MLLYRSATSCLQPIRIVRVETAILTLRHDFIHRHDKPRLRHDATKAGFLRFLRSIDLQVTYVRSTYVPFTFVRLTDREHQATDEQVGDKAAARTEQQNHRQRVQLDQVEEDTRRHDEVKRAERQLDRARGEALQLRRAERRAEQGADDEGDPEQVVDFRPSGRVVDDPGHDDDDRGRDARADGTFHVLVQQADLKRGQDEATANAHQGRDEPAEHADQP